MGSRSTFPIPTNDLLREIWKRVKRHPMTWIPVGLFGVGALVGSGLGLMIGGAALIGGGLYWKGRWSGLKEVAAAEWVEEHNEDQNDALYRKVKLLDKYKCGDLADSLKRFVYLKRDIESGLHGSGDLTPAKEEMEKLVDSLCFEVADELRRISDIRYTMKKGRKRLSKQKVDSLKESEGQLAERVEHAHQTLTEMQAHLGTILNPLGESVSPSANPVLDETIATLKEETVIAQRVRRRIEADYGDELVSESSETETQPPPMMAE